MTGPSYQDTDRLSLAQPSNELHWHFPFPIYCFRTAAQIVYQK